MNCPECNNPLEEKVEDSSELNMIQSIVNGITLNMGFFPTFETRAHQVLYCSNCGYSQRD